MSATCCRFLVRGRVQGVFFRASTAKVARSLALTGYAINLDDGRVEVLACGQPAALDQLATWLAQGPPASSVVDVSRNPVPDEEMAASGWPPATFSTG